jgi:hypothetical protein
MGISWLSNKTTLDELLRNEVTPFSKLHVPHFAQSEVNRSDHWLGLLCQADRRGGLASDPGMMNGSGCEIDR